MNLTEAVHAVFNQHPDLADKAVVERYPLRSGERTADSVGGIFAYQFMNTSGRNIATYIPDLGECTSSANGGLQFQKGMDGKGRDYPANLIRETEDILALIELAREVESSVNPGGPGV